MQHSKTDNALAAIKAGLNLVPVVGGAIASLVGDYVPTSTQRSIEKAMKMLGEKLNSLNQRIDIDAVNKEDFSELFKSCYLVIIRSQREEKLRIAANLLANVTLKEGDQEKVPYTELDHLVRCLDSLSIGAINVLKVAFDIRSRAPMSQRGTFQFQQLRDELKDFETSLLMGLVSELRGMNFIEVQEPGIRVPDYGNFLLELTPVGKRFVERFILGEF
ncbi:MAG TPA: hypothetical protein VHX99_02905 [Rhizomicrobium sp.]|jgi:hypothetical protein|nr:hypothetical protein [Rhizomicrobium sp.]